MGVGFISQLAAPWAPPAPLSSSCSSLQGPADSTGSPGPGGLARCPAWWLPRFPECPVPRDAGGRAWAWAPHPGTERVPIARGCGPGLPLSGTRGHGRKTDRRSPSCFSSFPFRSLEFHCHNLIYGVFYLREKARAPLSCGFVFVACASGRESFPKHAGPWLSRGRASV